MKRSKRKKINKIKVLSVILGILLLIVGIIVVFKIFLKPVEEKKLLMLDIVGKDINEVKELLSEYELDINTEYKYNDDILKDKVISQSIIKDTEINKGDKLDLVVSLGKRDLNKLKNDGINELGKVPIMMYHGIKNISNSDTKYTGGNVDKDGYTRTAEAFRNDLEFYYTNGYRMVKLSDYINGNIDIEYGKSPIVLTFDDGNDNNILVTGLDEKGNIIIDKNSAVGILEEFKMKHPDAPVSAIFFVTSALFNQPEYNEKILKWLIDNGYEVGNHTKGHNNLSNTSEVETEEVIGTVYNQLKDIIGDKYSKIVALPFGTPYNKTHVNYKHVLSGEYNGVKYETEAALRVGWEPEVSPYHHDFDKQFLKRCRAYDNNGVDFDIKMVFRMLDTSRYVSDGDKETIITSKANSGLINNDIKKEIVLYE